MLVSYWKIPWSTIHKIPLEHSLLWRDDYQYAINYVWHKLNVGTRGGAFGWGTALQTGRSRVRFPMVSLEFCIPQSFRLHYDSGVNSASNGNEYQEYFLEGKGGRCVGWQAYLLNVPIFLKSVSLDLQEPSRPVQACKGIALDCTNWKMV